MSLTDAFLLDPAPFNVWISYRTDGAAGSGTQTATLRPAPEPSRVAPAIYNLPYGVGGDSVGQAVINENVIDLGNPHLIRYHLSDQIQCFENQRASGELIRGHSDQIDQADELATLIEDALLMSM